MHALERPGARHERRPPGRRTARGRACGPAEPARPSRRQLLAGAGLGAGAVAGGLAGYFSRAAAASPPGADGVPGDSAQTVPFYGPHQAGIATPAQDRLAFGSLNVVAGATRADLRDLLREWTAAAARMARGRLVGEDTDPYAPPVDTGEAVGSPVSRLTITLGYGPALFDHRFGLAGTKPAALAQLPPLPNENLDPDYTGGDLCLQACSDDPLVAFHAVRNLARLGMGVVEHNWMELGFGRTSTTTTAQATPRNLLGFKDGTRNIKAEQARLMDELRVGRPRDRPAVAARRQLPGRPQDPDLRRELGPRLPRGPGERHRPGQGHPARRCPAGPSSPRPTSPPGAQPGSPPSRPGRTSGWPAPSTTAGPGSCAAATPSPTASTRRPGPCSAACSSSPS